MDWAQNLNKTSSGQHLSLYWSGELLWDAVAKSYESLCQLDAVCSWPWELFHLMAANNGWKLSDLGPNVAKRQQASNMLWMVPFVKEFTIRNKTGEAAWATVGRCFETRKIQGKGSIQAARQGLRQKLRQVLNEGCFIERDTKGSWRPDVSAAKGRTVMWLNGTDTILST